MSEATLRQEWRACLRFLRFPRPRRLPGRSPALSGWASDWIGSIPARRLFGWALTLWAINLLVLGPFVLAVFELSGATHRIDVSNLPWLQAILWGPIVEELLFRYGLRRPVAALWMVPLLALVLVYGLVWWATTILAVVVLLSCWIAKSSGAPSAVGYRWLRRYARMFPVVFHLVALAFAAVHLRNFVFGEITGWMMIVLVAPQWVTGLVLGWVRVTRGVGASMFLHGVFNTGPLVVAWLAFQFIGDL